MKHLNEQVCTDVASCWCVPWRVASWSNRRLKHQVEGDRRREVISCGGRLHVVFHKKISQLLLSVVVHLKQRDKRVIPVFNQQILVFSLTSAAKRACACCRRCVYGACTWVITSSIWVTFSAEHFSSSIRFFKWAVNEQTSYSAAITMILLKL